MDDEDCISKADPDQGVCSGIHDRNIGTTRSGEPALRIPKIDCSGSGFRPSIVRAETAVDPNSDVGFCGMLSPGLPFWKELLEDASVVFADT